jgi:nucleoside-diphosphate kinase
MTPRDTGVVEEFLKVYRGVVIDFNDVAKEIASGPSLALEITNRENVIAEFRETCGQRDAVVAKQIRPKSIRALFGEDAGDCTDLEEDAQLEVEHFFALLEQRKEKKRKSD